MKDSSQRRSRLVPVLLAVGIAFVVLSRLCHLDLLWIEESYGMAAAAGLLHDKVLYTDIWFDKPPLYAVFYTLCAGQPGWPLRLLDIVWILLCALSVGLLGWKLNGRQTGLLAAALTCFALTFWIPSAVMAVAPDLLMLVPHVLAVLAISSGQPLLAGVLAGIALLCNSKGALVLAVVLSWSCTAQWGRRNVLFVLTGFAAILALSLTMLPLTAYWQQVWWWGARYSADTFLREPLREFIVRTSGWAAFHATVVIGTALYLWRTRDWRMGVWILISVVGIVAGLRFFPRYYFQLLPPFVLAGTRGVLLLPHRWQVALLGLLLIPVLRFGPRYMNVAMSGPSGWSDAAMMEDSLQVSRLLGNGSLLVWGYRPDIFVFSGRPLGTRFLDSQSLTGVLADRHLFSSRATFASLAAENRRGLVRERPDYIVDGLGPLNPELAITRYSDLGQWLECYEEIGRTGMSIVLRRRPDGCPPGQER